MSWEQRNEYFCKAQTDMQMIYIEAEREVRQLKDENAKLRDERERLFRANVEKNGEILQLLEENARLREELEAVGTAAYLYGRTDLADENAKLREQTELLVTLLRNDCDIEASWDGLRHYWSIELTEDGCLMRDRACKAEAENAKLREFIDLKETCWKYVGWCDECPYNGVDDKHDDCTCMVREKVNSLASELGVEVDK